MIDLTFEKGLPSSVDTERLVLGALMLDDLQFASVSSMITAEDFSLEKHKRIFARMVDLYERGERIDRVTLTNELKVQGQLESVDGLGYILGLDDGLPDQVNLDSYLRIVKEKSILRRTIFGCQSLVNRCMQNDPPESVLADGSRMLASIEADSSSQGSLLSAEDLIVHGEGSTAGFLRPGDVRGIPYPWGALNRCLIGLQEEQFVILAARPSVGKSALALQVAHHAAKNGFGVAVFSLEMGSRRLLHRLVCSVAGVNFQAFRTNNLDAEELKKVDMATTNIADLPIYFDDSARCTVGSVHAAVRKLRTKKRVDLVIIDYLQLMASAGRFENKNAEVSHISRALKLTAKELKVPVLALAQLNRGVEKENREPQLSDLRDSGSLEQDADVVMFIHREQKRDAANEADLTEPVRFIVAKQRDGPLKRMEMLFLKQFVRFEESHVN